MDPAPFITFYSFKGGVGRSMAVINVAALLADHGFRVLVLDLDLEAPGISYLAVRPPRAPIPGFVDVLNDAVVRGPDADLFRLEPSAFIDRYTVHYELPLPTSDLQPGELRIMVAGSFDATYQHSLATLGIPTLYSDGRGQPLIRAFKQILQSSARFDFVLVDSRTGFSDEAGICTRDLADHLVVVTGLNHQNVVGTGQFLRALRAASVGDRPLHIVLSPVPDAEEDLTATREDLARAEFSDAWGSALPLDLRIHYHPRLALTEEPHISRTRTGRLHDEYVSIERALRQTLGLSTGALVERLTKALGSKDDKDAERALHLLIRLAGKDELDLVLQVLALRPTTPFPDALLSDLAKQAPSTSPGLHALAIRLHDENRMVAETYYRRAAKGTPRDSSVLGNFALFMTDVRREHDEAERLYRRALDVAPHDANTLGNFATFMTDVRRNHDEAERLYRRALDVAPHHVNHLGNFANFLKNVRRDHDEAELLYRRALDVAPRHANILGNFATLIADARRDHKVAERLYRLSLDINPHDANHLGNFAKLLFAQGRLEEGREYLQRAFPLHYKHATLQCELNFYAFAHVWTDYPDALAALKQLLVSGERISGWPLADNVARAHTQGHPHPALVSALARVLSDDAPLAELDAFDLWRDTLG